jgi:solute carrier family 13 (sodium-dependent dicarboxylate transporter), member 2/3/5
VAHALNARTVFGLVLLFAIVGAVVSETTSNAASATMVVPVAIAVAQGAGVNPIQPALAACLGASMGFMLPVSTPPNAIVYGSGRVPLVAMMRYGVMLDLLGVLAVTAVVYWLVPLVLKL